jgi:L-iditol 2-dehydrogenase
VAQHRARLHHWFRVDRHQGGPVDRPLAVDPIEHRRHAALQYGAALALSPEDLFDHQAIAGAVGPLGVDVAFEVAGVNDAVEHAIAMAMPGGRVVLVGIPDDARTSFGASAARRKASPS